MKILLRVLLFPDVKKWQRQEIAQPVCATVGSVVGSATRISY